MVALVTCSAAVVILICVIAFSFYILLAEQKRAQGDQDKMALLMAKTLNENDRIGQINNLVVRSRELVFVSRTSEDQVLAKQMGVWMPLARQLCQEARSGALVVEAERQNQSELIRSRIQKMTKQYNGGNLSIAMSQPWWCAYAPRLYQVNLGYVDKVQSNILKTDVYSELRELDEQQRYVEPGTNLYKGNINARLPAPDSDLNFKLSSLPAPADDCVAPARLMNPEVYRNIAAVVENRKFLAGALDQIPSAIELGAQLDVRLEGDLRTVAIRACGATSGALPPR